MLVRVLQRNKTRRTYISLHTSREVYLIYIKVYVYTYREKGRESLKKGKIIGSHNYEGRQVKNLQGGSVDWRRSKEPTLHFKSKGHLQARFPLHGGSQSFVLLRTSADPEEAHPPYGGQSVLLKDH